MATGELYRAKNGSAVIRVVEVTAAVVVYRILGKATDDVCERNVFPWLFVKG